MVRNSLNTSVMYLPGVGPKRAEALKSELGVETVADLLRIYPFRYVDRSFIMNISNINSTSAFVQIRAKVLKRSVYSRKLGVIYSDAYVNPNGVAEGTQVGNLQGIKFNQVNRMSVVVEDATGRIELVFFKYIKFNFNKLVPGSEFIFFGKPSTFNNKFNFVHPEIEYPKNQKSMAGAITGVYSSTEKLKNIGISTKKMNQIMSSALELALNDVEESMPNYLLSQKGLVPIKYALRNIHFPTDTMALSKAERRLKFEELFFLQLALLKQKYVRSSSIHGFQMKKVGDAFNKCYFSLPYELTNAQKRVIKEIRGDLLSGKQMNRLLQGDVGSGKTMVAVLTSLIAVGNGFQSCIMAPTEVLARQHYANISKYLEGTGASAAILTGSSKKAERDAAHEGLLDGSIDIIVGTHALIEDDVKFKNLGLAVIDEQHRFGVAQRAKLWKKSQGNIPPHILVMTATPIPRTLAMTLYGDLDVSVIDELPPGRKPVVTMQKSERERDYVYAFLKKQIAQGRQIFIVYPLIFESEKMDYQNLEKGYEDVVKNFPFPPYKTAIVHGQQKNDDKVFNMKAFAEGRANILVSTTVIEVGVDVPNASVMVIESSERFGLSQLHQLRGRVGRGSSNSYCILMHGDKVGKESRKRLQLMCDTEDGFQLAEEDLKLRGPGDLEGTQQSGLPVSLSLASLAKDGQLLSEAKQCAEVILNNDPNLQLIENQPLVKELYKDKYNIKDYSKIS